MGFIEKRSFVRQAVDVAVDAALIVIVEGEVPISDLRFEFYLAPRDSAHAIPPVGQLYGLTTQPTAWSQLRRFAWSGL